jgi:hypothetical protein
MGLGFFILGLGVGIALPYAIRELRNWMKNNPPRKLNNDAKE